MGKSPSLGVRLPPEVKLALEKAAREDTRSVSSMVEKVLTDWLRAKGYLPRDAAE
ncbi:Arc family DNA-binding protein [Acidisphaera sp. L21]|uniref:Arc family DNA-binding protein n=1 Tax=Acidisphaera sp. L21 TaxID=1641851 RepID=UPI00131BA513